MKTTAIVFAAAIFLCQLLAAWSIPSTFFSTQDESRVTARLNQRQQSSGLFGDMAATHATVGSLKLLDVQIPHKKELCSKLVTALPESSELEHIFHAVHAAEAAKCTGWQLTNEQKAAVQKALNSEHIISTYYATTTALKLIDNKVTQLEDFDFGAVTNNVLELLEDDGSFRPSKKSKQGSPVYAGMAFETLGLIFSKVTTVPANTKEDIRGLIAQVEKLIQLGGDDKNSISFPATQGRSSLVCTGHVFSGLYTLSTALSENLGLTEDHINRFATFFVDNKYVQTPADVQSLLRSLKILSKKFVSTPFVLTLEGTQVRVTDVFGKFVAPVSVVLKKAVSEADISNVLAQDKPLKPASTGNENVAFVLDVPALSRPGFYLLAFSVEPKDKQDTIKPQPNITRRFKTTGEIKGVQLRMFASKSPDGTDTLEADSATATYPAKFSSSIHAGSQQYLHARVSVSGTVEPTQVFIELVDSYNQRATFPTKKTQDTYEANLEIDAPQFQNAVYGAGDYSVHVIIGDALASNSINWQAGTVKLVLKKPGGKIAESTGIQREITHTFREDEKRPNTIISLIFTGLAAVPFLFLIKRLTALGGLNLRLPSSPSHFLFAVIFQCSIAAILGSFVLYWLFLNVLQALGLLAALSIVAVFSGQRALHAHNVENEVTKDKLE